MAGLSALSTELQELSRGMHPAVLSRSGLGAAIRSLARRSPIPVDVEVDLNDPIPESVGVAAYYVLAEALTNAAKHSGATAVEVTASVSDHTLHLSVRDDGVGGAVTRGRVRIDRSGRPRRGTVRSAQCHQPTGNRHHHPRLDPAQLRSAAAYQ